MTAGSLTLVGGGWDGHGDAPPEAVLDDVDGVLVGDGLTPARLDALLPLAERGDAGVTVRREPAR